MVDEQPDQHHPEERELQPGSSEPAQQHVPIVDRPRLRLSVLLTVLAVVACIALAVLVGPAVGIWGLAVLLAVGGVARLVLPRRWLPGLAVRSRGIDAAMLLVLALGIAVLASTAPSL